jgi:hypothetical protein
MDTNPRQQPRVMVTPVVTLQSWSLKKPQSLLSLSLNLQHL